jgi:hypothetical protein
MAKVKKDASNQGHFHFMPLEAAVNEKDVENWFRTNLVSVFSSKANQLTFSSPHNTDGFFQVENLTDGILECKYDIQLKNRSQFCVVLGQAIRYAYRFRQAGEAIPKVILLGDRDEAVVLSSRLVLPYLDRPYNWQLPPSNAAADTKMMADLASDTTITPWVFDLTTRFDFMSLAEKILKETQEIREQQVISPRFVMRAFQFWNERIVRESNLTEESQIHIFLSALSNPQETYLHPKRENTLVCGGKDFKVNGWGYRQFFNRFKETHSPSEVEAIVSSKDRMMEELRRRRQGAFFTPTAWVDEAHKMLDEQLGDNWRDEYVVWDASCGTANLTRDYKFKELYLSTLEPEDVKTINLMGYNKGATIFQFDFLNDPLEKLPEGLLESLQSGKKIVFLNNPPYGTANNAGANGTHKAGMALTVVNKQMVDAKIGACSQQLYAQYLYRLNNLGKNAVFATFTKPSFMTSPSFEKFRQKTLDEWQYLDGMVFQASHFADVSDRWGVSFTIFKKEETQ